MSIDFPKEENNSLIPIVDKIRHWSKILPDKTAIITPGGDSFSYTELNQQIDIALMHLISSKVERDDIIILAVEKSIDFISVYFAAHRAGFITLPLDSEINGHRLQKIISLSSPKLILGKFRNFSDLDNIDYKTLFAKNIESNITPSEISLDSIADIMFTTGTTGDPKGVLLTIKNEIAAARNINSFIGNKTDDIELIALPLCHSFGLGRLRAALSNGQTVVLINGFASMKKFYGAFQDYHITGFGMVPSSWAYISKMSGDKIAEFSSQLKYIEIGSAPLSLMEKERLMRLLPDTKICMHYGLTEASRSCFISFHEESKNIDTAGKASPNCEIKIFSNHGVELAQGLTGEVCVKGDHVCSGYLYRSKEEYLNDFYNEFFRTGDLGFIDDNNYLHLQGRYKEIINVGGKKVEPIEVEEVIKLFPGIEEVACVGYPDKMFGEVVKAFVTGSTAPEDDKKIIEFVSQNLENYKVPVYISHIGSLPKTSSGKIQRLKLKE